MSHNKTVKVCSNKTKITKEHTIVIIGNTPFQSMCNESEKLFK
jgi:hypothetical protein